MKQLQPAGEGLPALERGILGGLLKAGCVVMSDASILKAFIRESENLVAIAGDDQSYDVFHPLLIPRVIGIEDSSRKWSVMMVLEHLCMANKDILTVIEALMKGQAPKGEMAVEDYKPKEVLDYEALDRYESGNICYVDTIRGIVQQHGNLLSPTVYRHPWFGMLNAHQWHFLAWAHQKVHRRQAMKIVTMLGVT